MIIFNANKAFGDKRRFKHGFTLMLMRARYGFYPVLITIVWGVIKFIYANHFKIQDYFYMVFISS